MKRISLLLISLLFSLCLTACNSKTSKVVIIYTNDVHCSVDNYDLLSSYVASVETKEDNVVVIDGGDFLQGSIYGKIDDGASIIKIMNSVGYDLVVPGNHEYDYGADTLIKNVNNSNFKYLTCNNRKGINFDYEPYYIGEYDGYKVGFLGIENNVKAEEYLDIVQKYVDELHKQDVKLVVAIGHTGGETTDTIIENTSGIDIFINAHNHVLSDDKDNKLSFYNVDNVEVPVYEAGSNLSHVCRIDLELSNNSYKHNVSLLTMDDLVKETDLVPSSIVDSKRAKTKEIIDSLKVQTEELNRVIGTSECILYVYDPVTFTDFANHVEYNSSDFVADAYRSVSGADIALVNTTALRVGLQIGDITKLDICNLVPWFEDTYIIELSGQQVLDVLENKTKKWPAYTADQPAVSGMSFCIDTSKDKDRVYNIKVNGEPFDVDATYTVASSYYYLFNSNKDILDIKPEDGTVFGIDNDIIEEFIVEYLNGVIPASKYENLTGDGRIFLGY